MAKNDEQFKLKVAREYLTSTGSGRSVAARHKLSQSVVRRWAENYREHCVAGLRRQSGSYSASFKESVLLKAQREGLSDRQAAVLFGIRSEGHIATWRAQYDAGGYRGVGAQALRSKHAA